MSGDVHRIYKSGEERRVNVMEEKETNWWGS
jgi:hypothetical protein